MGAMNPLILELRQATAAAHERLEHGLDLLAEPPSRDRFVRVLSRFHGFHRIWEPAMAETLADPEIFDPRRRLSHLEADLARLGVDTAALPACQEAAALARGEGAIGSLYVMEGSTLGGQVIARSLAKTGWAPEGGLSYFQPYGSQTGVMWRAFGDYAAARTPPEARAAVIGRAIETFETLRRWLT